MGFPGCLKALPQYVLEDIINRLEDARDIAKVQSICREWRDAGNNVRSLRIVCLDEYHDRARNISYDVKSLNTAFSGKSLLSEGAGPSTVSGSSSQGGSSQKSPSFKGLIVEILRKKHFIVQLRIEVEAKLQSKSVQDSERRRTDFWLTDSYFLRKWLPRIGSTLQHLCIVDYGQQAIMRRSSIVKILSESCECLLNHLLPSEKVLTFICALEVSEFSAEFLNLG